ncbi:NAD-dependent isocitrate dehydrogenase [Teratosphaeriaceae sp. CCFEE 6253]|nr:NAD-dependent isocitrate dehydrogenase [Teratosphaeriaceae sp. CCFEE 6253]
MLGGRCVAATAARSLPRQAFQHRRQLLRPAAAQVKSYATATPEREKVAHFKGKPQSDGKYMVTLIEGDGIGPEIAVSVKDIFSAANVPIKWESVDVTPTVKNGKTVIPDEGTPPPAPHSPCQHLAH